MNKLFRWLSIKSKLIIAFVGLSILPIIIYMRRERADVIIQNLEIAGVKRMTVIDVYALSEWADQKSYSYSIEFVEKYSKVIQLEIVCDDEDADKLAEIIAKYGYTGNSGDGMIFISPIEKSIKIKTKEVNVI